MFVYLLTLLIVTVTAAQAEKHRIRHEQFKLNQYDRTGVRFIRLTVFILAFVSGFRWYVGTDFGGYVSLFYRAPYILWNAIRTYSEPGTPFISLIARYIYNKPVSFFVLSSLLTVFLYINTIKKYSNDFLLSVLLYVFIGSWHGAFNGVRQYIAAAIVFAGHRYIYERKFVKYLLVVAIASLFHRTVWIMAPVYFIVSRKITLKNLVLAIAASVALRLSYELLFSIMSVLKGSDQTQYSYMNTAVNVFRVLVAFAPLLLVPFLRCPGFFNPENSFYIMMMIVNACFMLGTSGSAYLARAGVYTEAYMSIALPKLFSSSRKDTKLLRFVMVVCYLMYWLYDLSVRGISNYHWWFAAS